MAAEEELIKDSDDNESDIASDKETEFLEDSAEKRDVSGYFEDEATEDKNIDKKRKRVDSEEEENAESEDDDEDDSPQGANSCFLFCLPIPIFGSCRGKRK